MYVHVHIPAYIHKAMYVLGLYIISMQYVECMLAICKVSKVKSYLMINSLTSYTAVRSVTACNTVAKVHCCTLVSLQEVCK